MIEIPELSAADWIARIIWLLSAVAAWGALYLSWQHHKWLKSQRKTKLRAHAKLKNISLDENGRRQLRFESVTVTLYNYGRAVEIEAYLLMPWHFKTANFPFYKQVRATKEQRLENNHSFSFGIGCHHFRAINHPTKWRRLRVSLSDGKTVKLKVKNLKQIAKQLSEIPESNFVISEQADYSGCELNSKLPNFIYRCLKR